VDAPAGTLVYVRPGTQRGAHARAAETTVLAIGAKRGEVFSPSSWEIWFAADGYRRAGNDEKGREVIRAAVDEKPDDWNARYNFACYEALSGRTDEALEQLRRAAELDPEETRKAAATDTDLDSIRSLPEFSAIAGQPDAPGSGP